MYNLKCTHRCRHIWKNYESRGHKTFWAALGCREGVGFWPMARERMPKLLKYDHFEGHTGHIIVNFMIIKNYIIIKWMPDRFLGSSPSDENWELTIRSATLQSGEKYLIKIECADLENEAKTTRTACMLSFNFVVATSCPVTPSYSLSLSKVRSTNHGL